MKSISHSIFLAACLVSLGAQAATFTVNSTLHGTDSDSSTTTLVEAIQQANTAGGANVIELASGTVYSSDDALYIDGTSAGRTMYPAITSTITIHGNGATLDATGKNARFFYVSGSGSLTLEDINLSGAKAQGGDGASGNFGGGGGGAGMGGAIFVNGSSASLTMHRASIFGCTAKGGTGQTSNVFPGPGGGGGGMGGSGAISGGGGPRSAASGNSGGDGVGGNSGANNGGFGGGGGGGIESGNAGAGGFGGGGGGGWTDLPNFGNGATGGFGGGGGGTVTPFSTPFASGGAFGGRGCAYNSSGFGSGGGGGGLGGGIFNYQGTVTLENVTVTGNNATGGNGNSFNNAVGGSGVGGGIFNYDGSVTLKHVTVNANTVATDSSAPGVATGGALYNYDAPGGGTPSVTIYNSIFDNSTYTGASGVEVINNGSGSITASGAANSSIVTSSTGLSGTVLTSSSQLALNERKNGILLIRPLSGSPAIDAGDATHSLSTDAAGTSRPQGGGVDIGAAEGAFSTAVSLSAGMLLVGDTQADAVFAIDTSTGNRTLVSKLNYVGTGPDIGNVKGITVDSSKNIYVVNSSPVVAIVKIDPTTGNRTTVSSSAASVGTGPAFFVPSGITIRPSDGKLLVSDTGGTTDGTAGSDAIFIVDPSTGNRTILSDDVTPSTANALTTANTIIYHSTLGILVANSTTTDTVTKVADGTGARTVFTSNTVPNGTNPISNPLGLAEDTDGSILLVENNTTAGANRQLLRLDKSTGARSLVANLSTVNNYSGVAAGTSGVYVTKTSVPQQVQKVNTGAGTVSALSGNTYGDGVLFGNTSGTIGFGIGIALIPGSAGTTVTSLNRVNSTPGKSATVNWTLTFASAVTGVASSNFSLSGAAATGASVGTPTTSDGGVNWNVPVTTGGTDGTLTLSLANATGLSQSITTSLPFGGQSYTMDKTAPTISIGAPSASITAGRSVSYTVTYSDANFSSSTLTAGNITVNSSGSASAGSVIVTGSGTSRTVTLSGITGDGTLGISISAATASDLAGNATPAAGPSTTFSVDNTAPTISISAPSVSTTSTGPVTYTVTYSDANFNTSTLVNGNVTLNTTGTATGTIGITGSGTSRTVTISGITGLGTIGISIGAGTASDNAGHTAPAAGPSATFTVQSAPTVTTVAATSVTLTGAALNATINPNGLSTTAGFESGPDTNYGTTNSVTLSPDDGTTDQNVSITLSGLTPATTYHYLAIATNSVGITSALDLTFTTATNLSAPTAINLSNSSVAENQPSGTVVGNLTDTDSDVGDTATFTLVSGTGSTDNASFQIVGNQLQTAASFDFETKNSYSVRIRVTDSGGLTLEQAFPISILNVNEPPIFSGYSLTAAKNT